MTEDKKPTLLLVPKGTISKTDKVRLIGKGYFIVEVEDPDKIKTVADLGMIGSDLIAVAAIETIHHPNTATSVKERFAQLVLNKVIPKNISDQNKV